MLLQLAATLLDFPKSLAQIAQLKTGWIIYILENEIQARNSQHNGPNTRQTFAHPSLCTGAPYPITTPGLHGFTHSIQLSSHFAARRSNKPGGTTLEITRTRAADI
jgi:hypothetical protein